MTHNIMKSNIVKSWPKKLNFISDAYTICHVISYEVHYHNFYKAVLDRQLMKGIIIFPI